MIDRKATPDAEPVDPADVVIYPACAEDLIPGRSVIRTFDGDLAVTGIHTTASGFVLAEFDDHPIRPFHATDVVYVVYPAGTAS